MAAPEAIVEFTIQQDFSDGGEPQDYSNKYASASLRVVREAKHGVELLRERRHHAVVGGSHEVHVLEFIRVRPRAIIALVIVELHCLELAPRAWHVARAATVRAWRERGAIPCYPLRVCRKSRAPCETHSEKPALSMVEFERSAPESRPKQRRWVATALTAVAFCSHGEPHPSEVGVLHLQAAVVCAATKTSRAVDRHPLVGAAWESRQRDVFDLPGRFFHHQFLPFP
eukprot:SAG25_NODE_840_length_5120_cov_3.796455_2_plen_228_part_00